jgi:hypothetical protein
MPRSRRRRIVAELADHLACDPSAQLGEPAYLAQRFADELGTAYARRAGFAAFLSLVPFGAVFALLFALHQHANAPILLGTQLAFVGGTLAGLRAWRVRAAHVVPGAQASVLRRRVALATVGAGLTVGGLVASSHTPLTLAVAAVGACSVAASVTTLVPAARLRPVSTGPAAGNLATDLGRDGSALRLACLIAAGVALCIAVNGLVQSDPFDGLAAGILDGIVCLGGFAALGRWLGLR